MSFNENIILENVLYMNYLYIMRSGNTDYYKIGISDNVEKIRTDLQTGNQHVIKIIDYYPIKNARAIENLVHKKFARYKTDANNEWFYFNGVSLENIKNMVITTISEVVDKMEKNCCPICGRKDKDLMIDNKFENHLKSHVKLYAHSIIDYNCLSMSAHNKALKDRTNELFVKIMRKDKETIELIKTYEQNKNIEYKNYVLQIDKKSWIDGLYL